MGLEQYTSWLIGVSLAIFGNVCSNLGLNVCMLKYIITILTIPKHSFKTIQFQKLAHMRREQRKQSFIVNQQSHQSSNSHHIKKNGKHSSHPDAYQRQESVSLSSHDQEHPIPLPLVNIDDNDAPQQKTPSVTITETSTKAPKQGSYVCDGYWLLGMFGQVMGGLLDFAALGYAPQSVVAPLGALTLVVNVMLSPCMHNEKPSIKTMLATGIIMIGAAVTVASSPRDDSVDTIDEIFALYENTSFLIYAILTGGFITIGWCLTQYYVYLSRHKQRRYTTKYYKQHRFVIAAISGTMGAQNVLFAKSVSTLVVKSIENKGRSLFVYWETYLLLASLVSSIYFQLRWLNSALKRFSALYVAPLFQAFWITVSVMGGLVVYREFTQMLLSQKIVFPIGVIVTIIGVFYLTTQGQPEKYTKTKQKPEQNTEKAHRIYDNNNNNGDNDHGDMQKKNGDDYGENVVSDSNNNNNDELGGSENKKTLYFQDDDAGNDDAQNKLFNEDERGFIGLIKNLSELGEASIVTGSSLGKLLLDPQNIYKDIKFGPNIAEDKHFKGILSPTLEESFDDETISSEQLVDENQSKNVEESLSFLPEIEEDSLFEYKDKNDKKWKKKKKKRRHSFHDSSTDHHSDSYINNNDRQQRRRRRQKKKIKRSRSHSPPLTADEMAPHEVVWEKFTSIFVSDKSKQNEKDCLKLSQYASLETPEFETNKQQQTVPEIEDDIDVNDHDQTFSSAIP